MENINNECADVLSDYIVHSMPNNTNQLYAHSPPCRCTCFTRWHFRECRHLTIPRIVTPQRCKRLIRYGVMSWTFIACLTA